MTSYRFRYIFISNEVLSVIQIRDDLNYSIKFIGFWLKNKLRKANSTTDQHLIQKHIFSKLQKVSFSSFRNMICHQKRTLVFLISAGMTYLSLIYIFGGEEETTSSSLPRFEANGNRHNTRNILADGDNLTGIYFKSS